jgi:hypothetical protein
MHRPLHFFFEQVLHTLLNAGEVAMETVRFFLKHYPAGAAEAFRLFTVLSQDIISNTCIVLFNGRDES